MNKNKEHFNRKAKIIQWCEKQKDKTINFKIIHKKHNEEQGRIFKNSSQNSYKLLLPRVEHEVS